MIGACKQDALDAAQLRRSVDALDPVVALLCLVHLTGDRSLLASLGPTFDGTERGPRSTFAGPGAAARKTADPAIVADIRDRLVKAMLANPTPLLPHPGKALFRQMVELCLGAPIDDAACRMGSEQAGFTQDEGAFEPTRVPPEDFSVLVVGAGMVGINAAIKLKAAGFKFHIVEKRSEVGGTWSINTYPNVAVDTPSVQYSFSFELNPSWTKYYPRGPEYLAYLKQVTEKYGLLEHIEFNTSMKSCAWDETRRVWTVICVRDGQEHVYEANAVITALGFLSRPSFPEVPGLETFGGPVVHSGLWDDSVDLAGKKVVVVGTGATSLQLATAAAAKAGHLTVIQRQPNWLLPDSRVFADVTPDDRWALENIPFVLEWQRFQSLSTLMTLPTSMAKIDPEWRAETGGISRMNDGVRKFCLGYIEAKFADRPDLKAKITPDFPFFAKRPILDCGFYDTLKRENVSLVEGALLRCEEDAVILADGTRILCDVLLLATGYKLDFLTGFDIRGRGGQTLAATWTPYPYAYLGLEVPGFPNLFTTSGPNSGLTASHTTTGEQQVHYIVEMLKAMVERDLAAVEVKEEACDSYCTRIHEELDGTVWMNHGTAHGYYRHASGKIVLGYPGTNLQYWKALREPVLADHLLTPRQDAPVAQREREEMAVV
jgi:cation diffusion facilitator CzcD-associated flavoprotein CzcO